MKRVADRPFQYEFPRPAMTADCLVFGVRSGRLFVVLIRRRRPPFAGKWAIPGGFVDEGERLQDAARRELREETGLSVGELWPMETFGDPGRDPRGWTVSAPFYALVDAARCEPRGDDDADRAAWRSVDRPGPLAFDHRAMLASGVARLRREIYDLPLCREVLAGAHGAAALAACFRAIDPHSPAPKPLLARLTDAGLIKVDRRGVVRFR